MTEKQFRYIRDLCGQTIDLGTKRGVFKYEIKPELMKEKMLTLPQPITQNLIEYGKAWKSWGMYIDLIFVEETIAERAGRVPETDYLEEKKEQAWKKMREISKALCKQLDEIKWGK